LSESRILALADLGAAGRFAIREMRLQKKTTGKNARRSKLGFS